jgi:hypothetical protein
MSITPDTKDWTWVLERPCPECGFDTRAFRREEVGAMIRGVAAEWREILAHPAARERPRPDMWSPLEYACHVRDGFRLYDERLGLMLTQDDPLFANWDQDQAAVERDYGGDDPATVAQELVDAGESLAQRFDAVRDDEWERRGRRSDGAAFTIETFARYFIHDPIHHVHDVRHLER